MERERLRVKITKSFVDRQPLSAAGQQYLFDSDLSGFGLCIGKTKKTYFAERAVRGTGVYRRVTIGAHGLITAEEARNRAKHLLLQMTDGIDPVAERERQQAAERAAENAKVSLKTVWDKFKAIRHLKTTTLRDYSNYINTAFAGWLERSVQDITRDDVAVLHGSMSRQLATSGRNIGKPKTAYADGAFRVLGSVLSFAKARGYITSNPVDVIGEARSWHPAVRRRSVIQPQQLPAWFAAVEKVRGQVEEEPTAPLVCDYLEFVLFTGLRKEEAASLTWYQVDFKEKCITIADTKNHQPHILPITDHVVAILQRRQTAAGESKWVFPSAGRKQGPGYLREPRYMMDLVEAESGVGFILHDLRRTFISTAERLDLSYYAVKKLVNHKMTGDVTAGYVVADVERLRQPMEKITEYLLRAKTPSAQGLKIAS